MKAESPGPRIDRTALDNVMRIVSRRRASVGAAALAVAGILFFLYPAIRPYSDESSLQGAAAFGSTAWLVAHVLAMLGFTLLTVGLLGLNMALHGTRAESLSFSAVVAGLLGVGLTLPYYGGEAFGLHAIGEEALRQHSAALMRLADVIRGSPQEYMFTAGLLLIAVGTILAAVAVWRSGTMPRWSGIPMAIAFALYLPQFFGTPLIRIAHGLLVAVSCGWLAVAIWQQAQGRSRTQ